MRRLTITNLLALALLAIAPGAALADRELDTAIRHERYDGARVDYHAKMTIIAERDVLTAQMTIELAREQWDLAIRANKSDDAGYWAKRHRAALAEAREARERGDLHRTERDRARRDFAASAAQVRKRSG